MSEKKVKSKSKGKSKDIINSENTKTSNVRIEQSSEEKTKKSNIINTNSVTNTDKVMETDTVTDSEVPNTFTSNILSLKRITTINRLTKFEKARIIGTRASQIQNGMSPVFIKNGKQVDIPEEFKDVIKSSIDMAKLELKLKSCPLIIKRKLPSGKAKNVTIQEID